MPTYEFRCDVCGAREDVFCSLKRAEEEYDGDDCWGFDGDCPGHMRRQISGGAGVIFKGSGFYCTDYRKTPAPKEEP